MKYNLEEYKRFSFINGVTPVHIYKEGADIEEYYKDYNNALYYLFEENDGEPEEYWYLIMGYVHKDDVVNDMNEYYDKVKYIVNMDKEHKYVGCEWDFKNHCPIE